LLSIDGSISGNRQILLPVAVLGSRNPTDLTHFEFIALLDTGATSCGIGPQAVDKLSLQSHQKKPLSVATEMRMVEYYLFRLGLMPDANTSIPFVFAETDGFSWSEKKDFDVILGMDVLSQCDFQMDRSGRWELNFG